MKRKYFEIDVKEGYPFGKDVFYECKICDSIINSSPENLAKCKCQNIRIDMGIGRIIVRDNSKIKIFKE
jgi:hypothetical protein